MSKILEGEHQQLVRKEQTTNNSMTSCGWRVIALLLFYLLYLLFGAAVFSAIEAPIEDDILHKLKAKKNEFLAEHPCVTDDKLMELLEITVYSSKRGVYVPAIELDENKNPVELEHTPNWSFGQSFFFAATVVTTIGYGEQSPLSGKGKLFCIVYCVVGIPLTLLLLSTVVQRLLEPANTMLMWLNGKLGSMYQPLYIRLLHLILVFLTVFLLFLVIPSCILNKVEEEWNWFDSFYYCFISLTTVGLGDFIPGDTIGQAYRPFYKVLITVYLMLGLVAMMLLIAIFTSIPELDVTIWFLPSMAYETDPERQRLQTAGTSGPLYTQQENQSAETLRIVRARARRDDEAEWDDSSTKSQYGDD